MSLDLFEAVGMLPGTREQIGKQAFILRGLALPYVTESLDALDKIQHASSFRQMVTPGGFTMSIAMTNCGQFGWTTDERGYQYTEIDPQTGQPWPAMPDVFLRLARMAAEQAGFPSFTPDACLINRYLPGTRLSLHQDKNERDFDAPIVSVSLGVPATFLFGGHERNEKASRFALQHADVVVWGGVDRLRYHGVLPLKEGQHSLLGNQRINFTFRKAR